MSQRNARRPLILLFVLLQALAIITLTIPPTNPISLLNSTITSTAPTLLKDFVSHNVTSPGTAPNMMDYHITGTSLILRITETGHAFSKEDVNTIIDRAIRRVVRRINTGSGGERIQQGRFWQLSQQIDMHISALVDANFTYFLLGDVLAGVWQYMNQPWSSFREIVFDIIFDREGSGYIGLGKLMKRGPGVSSLGGNATSVLNLTG